MDDKIIARRRKDLEQLRDRMRPDANSLVNQALSPSGGQDAGDLSNAPFHLGDEGTEEFMHDMNAALAENEVYLLQEIQEAIGRIAAGTYGSCEECGKGIAAERLEVIPYTRHCVTCAAATQAGIDINLNAGRPKSPADTLAPEGAMQQSYASDDEEGASISPGRNRAAYDQHAVGEPGGGSAIGGLAGSNSGDGSPEISNLQEAHGSGNFDVDDSRDPDSDVPQSGPTGGAVGGTPARKRSV